MFDLHVIRQDFPIVESSIYMNHAAVGPIPLSVKRAMLTQIETHVHEIGSAWSLSQAKQLDGRRLAAKLVNGEPDRIAFIQNTSHGVSLIANGMQWQAGDEVLVPDSEFPSNYFAWKRLTENGVLLRHIPTIDGRILPETIEEMLQPQTRAVTLSHVQYFNGYRCDIEGIGALCRQRGIFLVVDGTQSIGAMHLDVAAAHVDALIVSGHKWMLGPLGIGFMALSERAMAEVDVIAPGWLSFTEPFQFGKEKTFLPHGGRFEPGTENSAGIFGLVARLEALDSLGAKPVEAQVLALTDRLCAGLDAGEHTIVSHRKEREKSGIVTFRHRSHPSEMLLAQLAEAGIAVSLRSGNIRVSPHYYNTPDEIDQLLDVIN